MEETGCDQGEAELALEMCGYVVEEAVKAIPRLHKNIVVFKGKIVQPEQNLFGLLLVIINAKSRAVLRTRAVLSYNPAVCAVSLEKDWFEFEKHLYGCRLWEGSLPTESLEIEQAVAGALRSGAEAGLFDSQLCDDDKVQTELAGVLKQLLRSGQLELRLKKDILDLGQYHSLRPVPSGKGELPPFADGGPRTAGERQPSGVGGPWPANARSKATAPWRAAGGPQPDELLVLKVTLESDPAGMPASELRAGDLVAASIADNRDIAKYLAKFFGGHSERGPVPIPVPVEAIEAAPAPAMGEPRALLVRVRFSAGVCGDAEIASQARLRAVRKTLGMPEKVSWWQRFFRTNK
jgi:hypothetical protein